jgi:hypothetical protein
MRKRQRPYCLVAPGEPIGQSSLEKNLCCTAAGGAKRGVRTFSSITLPPEGGQSEHAAFRLLAGALRAFAHPTRAMAWLTLDVHMR